MEEVIEKEASLENLVHLSKEKKRNDQHTENISSILSFVKTLFETGDLEKFQRFVLEKQFKSNFLEDHITILAIIANQQKILRWMHCELGCQTN